MLPIRREAPHFVCDAWDLPGSACFTVSLTANGLPALLKPQCSPHGAFFVASDRLSRMFGVGWLLLVLTVCNVPVSRPRRRFNDGLIVHLLFQQRPGHGRIDRDVILPIEDLVVTDDTKAFDDSLIILNFDPGTEESAAFLFWRIIHHTGLSQASL